MKYILYALIFIFSTLAHADPIYPLDKLNAEQAKIHFFTTTQGQKWYYDLRTFAIDSDERGTYIGGAFYRNSGDLWIAVLDHKTCQKGGKVTISYDGNIREFKWDPRDQTIVLYRAIAQTICKTFDMWLENQLKSNPVPREENIDRLPNFSPAPYRYRT